jgi:hypothetical protein
MFRMQVQSQGEERGGGYENLLYLKERPWKFRNIF